MKLHNKKGFTLVEVLIVVAIIAILAAIAIPIFSTQMSDAKEKIDESNLQAAKSMAYTAWMLEGKNEEMTFYAVSASTEGQLKVVAFYTSDDYYDCETVTSKPAAKNGSDYVKDSGYPAQAGANKDKVIEIVVSATGAITSAAWASTVTSP